jgi:hypothetical protein
MSSVQDQPIDVFEHGIEVAGTRPPSGLVRLATRERDMVYSGYTLAILDRDGTSLNHRVAYLLSTPGPYQTSDLWIENDVRYCLRSALYHLDRIINLYADKCRLFEQLSTNSTSGNTSDDRMYFEVDAFLGAARRVYDSISKVLWKHYVGRPQGRWRSIRTLIESDANMATIPAEYADVLKQSWDTFGVKLTDYRDLVMHIAPLAGDGATWMNRYDGRWGATLGLPSNPAAKSRANFDNVQGNGVDALSYCYDVAVHLVRLCENLMSLAVVESHIVNPSPQNYPLRQKSDVDPNPGAARVNR